MKIIRKNAAGIDIGTKKLFVSIEREPVKVFDTFTQDLELLGAYLIHHKIERVAMEATGAVRGFIKYSNIFEGNMSDSASLPKIIDNLRSQTSHEKRAIVMIDAGLATEENFELIKAKGYDYVCVGRSKIKDYSTHPQGAIKHLITKDNQFISLQKVAKQSDTDYILNIKSTGKGLKEGAMNSTFDQRFMTEINKISTSLTKKHDVKKHDKVNQRIGRAVEKYLSAARFYNINLSTENDQVTEIICQKKKNSQIDDQELGWYFIKTNLQTQNESSLWTIYNSIREIECSFRYLKTDLDLRPIYH